MTGQDLNAALPNDPDSERLVAEYRERIVKLEAHGLPEGGALWDVLGDILADIKRHQPPTNPEDSSRA